MKSLKKDDFADFLEITSGQKEVALAIAKNKTELSKIQKTLNASGFQLVKDALDLFKSPRVFVVIDKAMEKDLYDVMVQYSTGRVEIFDKATMRQQIFQVDYKSTAVIYIIEKSNLGKLREKGFDLLSAAGPAFQY